MRITFILSVAGGVFAGWMCSQWVIPRVAQSQESKTAKPAGEAIELDVLKAAAAAYQEAFNKGDAAAIAAQFTENAEVVDEDGNLITGRDNIKARFTQLFAEYPKAKVSVTVDSLRKLSPDVAVEDGYSMTTLNPNEPGERSPYTIVHLNRNGKWLIASVRDFPPEESILLHDQLQPLAWLVGDWVDESQDSRVETACQWSEDGNYLLQEYIVKLRGGLASKGTQRIAWDPLLHKIRSWSFDHSGGFGEATWTSVNGGWVIKASGVTPDGRAASVTRIVTQLGPDVFQMDTSNRLIGDELLPDVSIRVVRRPPVPTQ